MAATVRTSHANLTPRLQILFYDANSLLVSTATEADWPAVANTRPRRSFAARVPSGATQYRVGFLANVDVEGTTGTVYLDDVTTGGPQLIIQDAAGDLGALRIEVKTPARWI